MFTKNKVIAFLSVLMVLLMLSTLTATAADDERVDYLKTTFSSDAEKLATMELMIEKNGSQLYVDRVSGEIAFVDMASGQTLFSNPYDVGSSKASDNIKSQLMSQLIIKYEESGAEKQLDSYSDASLRDQITVKKTKSGVRVEYIIGEQVTRRLVPRLIERSRYEELIIGNITDERILKQFSVYYSLKDPFDDSLSDRQLREMRNSWPITDTLAVYVFDPKATEKEIDMFEGYIKEYDPSYTFEMLDEDHEMTKFEGTEKSPPLFRMALEYSIDDDGNLDVRLPANGIRFDETVYSLSNISILPYFGAGATDDNGEIFIPDGSGAVIYPSEFKGESITLTNTIYGQDYAYQKVSGAHQEIMHLPVYGLVHNNVEVTETVVSELDDVEVTDEETGLTTLEKQMVDKVYTEETDTKVGFLAIINEGDSLATITAENGGALHQYFTAFTSFAPRPKDSYSLADTVSGGGVYTVVSDRKYTDSYRIKYVMLNDDTVAEEKALDNHYTASYVGMAHAYRDYLESTGIIEKLKGDEINDDIPLFIESFGAIDTTKRIASIPVNVKTALTTFDDLKTMSEQLNEKGIKNINYKLSGFTNGGMVSTVPYKVEFVKAVGGNNGFKDFLAYAADNGILVFPDFDFTYFKKAAYFDGISNKNLVKTMDDRYSSKRVYESTMQSYVKTDTLAISPNSFGYLYDGFSKNFSKFNPISISVATLGSDLNSDFSKKNPSNREDSKTAVKDVLAEIKNDYTNVLSDAGNAYSLEYADNFLNVPLDSSNYIQTSVSVPFMGMVLHGYKNFTGTAVNMAGDIKYQVLKSIENGASVYFTLSYRNTKLLKESEELNKYYSVGFDIWFDDLTDTYQKLNEALSELQTVTIEDHEFILGERVPTEEEAEADRLAAEEAEAALEESYEISYQKALKKLKLQARRNGQNPETVTLDRETYIASLRTVDENTDVEENGDEYKTTKYTTSKGKIVVVTYSNGVKFILNYNNFDVTTVVDGETYKVDSLGFVKLK